MIVDVIAAPMSLERGLARLRALQESAEEADEA
jgi:hypothetical protein